MKTASNVSLPSGKTTKRNKRKSNAERPRFRALRVEGLESRELLSAATGGEFFESDPANIGVVVDADDTVVEAIAIEESSVAIPVVDALETYESVPNDVDDLQSVPELIAPASTIAGDDWQSDDPSPSPDIAESAAVTGSGRPSTYYDVDKSVGNTDADLCWAATASNMLWHTEWASVTNAQNEQEFYNTFFLNSWSDAGAPIENGVSWFLNDEFYYGSSTTTNASAGYYSQLMGQYGESAADYFTRVSATQRGALGSLSATLAAGGAVGLSCVVYNNPGYAHALSCWGYAVDESYSPNDPRYYVGLYVTDSDDEAYVKTNDELNERKLVYIGLEWRDNLTRLSSGGATVGGYLLDYSGRTGDNRFYLESFLTLKRRPSKYVVASGMEPRSTVVTTNLDVVDSYDGKISLREALANARLGATITFASSLKGKTIKLDSSRGELTARKSLTIDASNLRDATASTPGLTISGQGRSRILNVEWGDVEINGITLTGGYASDNGGAIYNYGGAVSLDNCVIWNNEANAGAGIFTAFGEATLTNCVVSNNTSTFGGAIYTYGVSSYPAKTTLVNCTVTKNTGYYCGGILCDSNSTTVAYNSIVCVNTSTIAAGADVYRRSSSGVANAYNTLSSYTNWKNGSSNIVYNASKPLFKNAATKDYSLATNSQAINKGNNQRVTTSYDLAGNPRINGGRVDLGAYEKIVDPIKLDAPGALEVTAKTETTIAASWDAVPHASGYRFIWKNQSDDSYTVVLLDAATTSYKMSGLDAGAIYVWKVLALGDAVSYLNSEYCATQRDKPRQQLPAPTSVEGVAGSTFATISWDAVPNALRYYVSYRLVGDATWSSDVNAGTGLSYAITGLARNTQYYVRVKAIGDGLDYKTSGYSATVLVKTTDSIQLDPPAPSVAAKTATSITAAWDAVSNADGYRFIWKNQSDDSYTVVLLDAATTSYKMSGLDAGAIYVWKVLALGDGVASLNSDYCATRRDKPQQTLAAPTVTAAVAASSTSATINWDAVPNAVRYSLSYKPASASDWTNVNVGTNLDHTIVGLAQNAEYDVRIKAIGDGVDYKTSGYSATVRVKTAESLQLDSPVPSVTAKTATTITASWDEVPNANGYRFIWKNQSDDSYTVVLLDASTTSYKITGLDTGAIYVWKLLAIGDGNAYFSSEYCATQRDKPQQTLLSPNLSVDVAATSLTVSWDAVPNVVRYSLSYKLASETTWSNNVNVGTSLSYTIDGLESGVQYDVRLKAVGDGIDYKSVYSNVIRVKTESEVAPNAPIKLDAPVPSVTAKTATTIDAAWDAVPNATGYRFIWKNQSDDAYTVVLLNAATTSYQLAGLDVDAIYVWKLLALGDGAAYYNSEYCATQRDKPQQTLAAPILTVAVAPNSLTVSWNAVPNADRYSVSYKLATESTWTNSVNVGTSLSYAITGLALNTQYDVRIKAIGDGLDYKSVYSEPVGAQTPATSSAFLDLGDELFDEMEEDDFILLASNLIA